MLLREGYLSLLTIIPREFMHDTNLGIDSQYQRTTADGQADSGDNYVWNKQPWRRIIRFRHFVKCCICRVTPNFWIGDHNNPK